MAIVFHCEHCGKKVEASNGSGGKRAKCPACHNKVYIPSLDSGEELKLAPINGEEEEKRKELMNETYNLTQEILLERDVPDGPSGSDRPAIEISEKELTKNIILYLRQMANGDLDDATRTADSIVPYGRQAIMILDKIAVSEMPEPELADVPPQVLSGLIRNLRTRIS
ncbi:MAG: TFIIB-type zinc ribbon-containing protein [Planctomycetota bacterium]|jgi:DNA-directed RNA polymerase subunit RPC12/RpoP